MVSESNVAGHPTLGVGAEEIRKKAVSALEKTGRIHVISASETAPETIHPLRATVELLLVRVVPGPPQEGSTIPSDLLRSEVAIELSVVRTQGDRLYARGQGMRMFSHGSPDDRAASFQSSLEEALVEASKDLAQQIEATGRSKEELISDLDSKDAQRRDLAIRALADRRCPEAVPKLIEQLQDPDREIQLRAVGALVSIGSQHAVPALIEATAQRDSSFVAQLAYAIGDIGGPDAEAYLFTASSGHPEVTVRRAAEEALLALRDGAKRKKIMHAPH